MERLNSSVFLTTTESNEAFQNMFQNFEFWKVGTEVILFWQAFPNKDNSENTLDDIVESMLEHHNLTVDTHCYIPFEQSFEDTLKYNLEDFN